MPENLVYVILLVLAFVVVLALIVVLVIDRRRLRRHPLERTIYALQEPTLCNNVLIDGDAIRRCALLVDSRGEHSGGHVYAVDSRLKLSDSERHLLPPLCEATTTDPLGRPRACMLRAHPYAPDTHVWGGPRRQEWPSE